MKKIFLLSAVVVLAAVSLAGCAESVQPTSHKGSEYVAACIKAGGEPWQGGTNDAPGPGNEGVTACIFPYPTLPKDSK